MVENILLSEITKIIDCEHKTAPLVEEGYPSIRTPNIGKGRLILDGVNRVSEKTYQLWSRRAKPQAGDIILAREAPVGNAAIIPQNIKVCLGQRTVLIKPYRDKICPEYLNYLINSEAINAYLLNISTGATVGHLNVTDIRKLKLPNLPIISNQKKIAAILTTYDDLIEINSQRIRILEKMAEEIYREWFVRMRFPGYEKTDFVKGIPKDWKISILDVIAKLEKYQYSNEEHENLPLVDLEKMQSGTLAFTKFGTADELTTSRIIFNKNDILFSSIRPYLYKVNMASFQGITNTSVLVIRPRFQNYRAFLTIKMFLKDTIDWANQYSTGTKMPIIAWKVLKTMKILIPPEQLLETFENSCSKILDQINLYSTQNFTLTKTRNIFLPRLISGKLSVENLDIKFPPSMEEVNA